jgi:hypothetical protein
MAFQIFSTAFAEGAWIPDLHSCHGADLSPSIEWSGAPGFGMAGDSSRAALVETNVSARKWGSSPWLWEGGVTGLMLLLLARWTLFPGARRVYRS